MKGYVEHSDGWRWLRLQQLNRNTPNVEFISEILNGRLPKLEVEYYPGVTGKMYELLSV